MSKEFKDWFIKFWKLGYNFEIKAEVAGRSVLVNVTCIENDQKRYFFFINDCYFDKFISDLKGVLKSLW